MLQCILQGWIWRRVNCGRCLCAMLCLFLLAACVKTQTPKDLPPKKNFTFKIYNYEKQDFQEGLVSYSGKLLLPPEYTSLSVLSHGVVVFKTVEGWGLLGEEGQVLYSSTFKQAIYGLLGDEELLPVQENGLYGFLRLDGTWAIEPQYEDAWYFAQGLAPVQVNGLWGFIDKQGKMIIEPTYERTFGFDSASYASTNLGYVVVNGRCGYINTHGEMVIPPIFQSVGNFGSHDSTVFMLNWRYGILGNDGQILVEPIYGKLEQLKFGLYAASMGDRFSENAKFGLIRSTGEEVTGFIYDRLGYMDDEGLMAVSLNGKRGMIRAADGSVFIEAQFDELWDFSGRDLAVAVMGEQCGYVDRQGQLRIDGLEECWNFSKDGLARVKRNGLWEYINEQGETVRATPYRELSWNSGTTQLAHVPGGQDIIDMDSGVLLLSIRSENGVYVARNNRGEQIWPVPVD